MITLEQHQASQRVIAKLERERDELAGALKQVISELKSEHNCSSVEEADKLILKLKKEYEVEERKYKKKLRRFFERNPKAVKKIGGPDIRILYAMCFSKEKTKGRKKKRKGTKKKD